MNDHSSDWLLAPVPAPCDDSRHQAEAHQATLTKPPGSLGRLETLAVDFAGWQQCAIPRLEQIAVRVFAADHGVCEHGVSAFPQSVTAQMIDNFIAGGAAINVLSRACSADFDILSLGTVGTPRLLAQSQLSLIAASTGDFTRGSAMTGEQLASALEAGARCVDQLQEKPQLFIGGEMGIGNTSSASLIYALLLMLPVEMVAGPGTGLDSTGVQHKQAVLRRAYARHASDIQSSSQPAMACLQAVGGFEIAALAGAYIRAAQRGIPVLVDGFIATAAWLAAQQIQPQLQQWSLFSHLSAEPAHHQVLEAMGARPLMDLGMRLGEGSGAAMAVPLLQNALLLHAQMATFNSAGIDGSST